MSEVLCSAAPYLPANRSDAAHHLPSDSLDRLLDTHFRLLRHDVLNPMLEYVLQLQGISNLTKEGLLIYFPDFVPVAYKGQPVAKRVLIHLRAALRNWQPYPHESASCVYPALQIYADAYVMSGPHLPPHCPGADPGAESKQRKGAKAMTRPGSLPVFHNVHAIDFKMDRSANFVMEFDQPSISKPASAKSAHDARIQVRHSAHRTLCADCSPEHLNNYQPPWQSY